MKKHHVILTDSQVEHLEHILDDSKTSQTVKIRCNILLNLNENNHTPTTEQQAAIKSGANISTVGNVLRLYSNGGIDAVVNLKRKPNSDTARLILDDDLKQKIMSLFCEGPPRGHKEWTYRMLAKAASQKLGITVGYATIWRALAKEITAVHTYSVAGFPFRLSFETGIYLFRPIAHYELFNNNSVQATEPLFHIHLVNMKTVQIPECVYNETDKAVFSNGNKMCFVYRETNGAPATVLMTDKEFKEATLAVARNSDPALIRLNILRMYSMSVTPHETLIMHATVVEYKGKGYLFTGKSGTGKSTHSRLWAKHIRGARLFNDDQPVVRIHEDGTAWVYGTPWGGKTPVYINEVLPVGGIIILKQAPSNQIRRARNLEAYSTLWSNIFNRFSMEQTDSLHNTINKLIGSAPVWHLDCLPNKDAAILCCKTVTE